MDDQCPVYKNEVETTTHALFQCPVAVGVLKVLV